jgi:hypothetical protein
MLDERAVSPQEMAREMFRQGARFGKTEWAVDSSSESVTEGSL